MRKNNPFPGVGNKPTIDRHGKKRWRLRLTIKGRKVDTYLSGPYGSKAFRAEYYAAVNPLEVSKAAELRPNTFHHIITSYLGSKAFGYLEASTRKAKRKRLDWIRGLIGDGYLGDLEARHVENLMDRKGGPDAANRLLKELSELYRYAQKRHGFNGPHPTVSVDERKTKQGGYHTWTEDEVQKFRDHFPRGSLPRLALEIMIGTGAARGDAAMMGRQNIKGPKIWYRRAKTGQDAEFDLSKLPELQTELRLVPRDKTQFFPYTVESFGNWFRDQCEAAGLPKNCRAHGLRKYAAKRLAEAGATEFQIMAFLAHKDPREAKRYVLAASRAKMTGDALDLLHRQDLSNHADGLDKMTKQVSEKKG